MNTAMFLSTFDFEIAYDENPGQAVTWLQMLLLDEEAVAARIDLLRTCAEIGEETFPDLAGSRPKDDFEAEYDLICHTGLFAALENGLLADQHRRERLALLINDPEALATAHQRLNADDGGEREADRKDDTEIATAVGCDTETRIEGLQANPAGGEAEAVERVLRRSGVNEPPWATNFREGALGAGVRSVQALLEYAPRELKDVAALADYRRGLVKEVREAQHGSCLADHRRGLVQEVREVQREP